MWNLHLEPYDLHSVIAWEMMTFGNGSSSSLTAKTRFNCHRSSSKYEYRSLIPKVDSFSQLLFKYSLVILSFLLSHGQNCVIPRLVDGEEFSTFLSTYCPLLSSQTHAAIVNVNWHWYVSHIDLEIFVIPCFPLFYHEPSLLAFRMLFLLLYNQIRSPASLVHC